MVSRARNISKLFGVGILKTDTGTGRVIVGDAVIAADSTQGDTTLADTSIASLSDVNLDVDPETLEIQVVASGPGQNPDWLWTWSRSALPYARVPITNSIQQTIPLYKEGTYTVNNYSGYDSDAFATGGDSNDHTHKLYLKWLEGSGTENNVSWVTYTAPNDRVETINNNVTTQVQRLLIQVPDSATLSIPTADSGLTAPSVTYNVTDSGGKYVYTGSANGDNPNLGPVYRGGTYTFEISAAGHPLYLTTDNGTNFVSGNYNYEYTTGVTNSRTDSGTLTFVVDSTAPDTLYYQCGNHSAMRGEITIKDLAVTINNNNRPVLYLQHTQEGHKNDVELRPVPTLTDQMCIVYDVDAQKFVPQDLATYVERTPSFKNKIREVAGTATLVAADGTAIVASVEVVDDASYLPLSGNSVGDLVYATDTETIYVWDGTEWQQNTAGIDSDGITAFIDSDYINNRQQAQTLYTVAMRQDGTLEATTGTARWYAPTDVTVTEVKARLGTAATTPGVAVRINKSGDSNSTISLDSGESVSTITPSLTLTDSDYLTIDVTQVGTSTAGADLYIQFTYTRD